MGDSNIRREKDDRQQPLDEEGWLADSNIWAQTDKRGEISVRGKCFSYQRIYIPVHIYIAALSAGNLAGILSHGELTA